jgi:hypothetical protein
MTTRAPEVPDVALRRSLQEAAAAVADADRALSQHDAAAAREAVLVLSRATHDALSELERKGDGAPRPDRLKDALGWWHQQLDEARLQLALAEMDAHGSRDELLLGLERRFAGVSELITTSVERMGTALVSLRKELQAYRHGAPSDEGS